MQRGAHNIEDELVFSNHAGYVFHDSRGFEAGGEGELRIVQEFIRRKSRERQLNDRLHTYGLLLSESVIAHSQGFLFRYCIPMDNDRPELDLKYFDRVCPDKNGTSNHIG
jgi:hypothetical protein